MKHGRAITLIVLVFGLLLFVYLALTLAQAGSGSSCHWIFPKWFGCVLSAHEALAGGLIGASGALIAAWIAWSAVQEQINAERERMMADRLEVERLLSDDLMEYADGMAAAWRLLVALDEQSNPEPESTQRVRDATAYMANWLSRPEEIANYRAMAERLGWDRRRQYDALISGLEELKAFTDSAGTWDSQEVLNSIRNLADRFEYCLPDTSGFFNGLWRRSPKAMSFADWVERIGGQG